MSRRTPIQHVELFHLLFLRALERQADRGLYVIKGGVNLRAWFGSLRYSEDLDIDVLKDEPYQLVEKPKQTDTTQRWKLQLQPDEGLPLPTKIEFSRRTKDREDAHAFEMVVKEVAARYSIQAPSANHYTAEAAIRQKIEALGGRRETQARDVWDLEHLFRTTKADPRPLGPRVEQLLEAATERAADLPFSMFKAQVVPFLDAEHQGFYESPEAWSQIQEIVVEALLALR